MRQSVVCLAFKVCTVLVGVCVEHGRSREELLKRYGHNVTAYIARR
jgi:hypothetical protein